MRKDFGKKPWVYPMPVFVVAAYDKEGVPNAMVAAWGGIYTDDMIGICLSEGHKTTKNIRQTGAFTVSMATVGQTAPCDYLGIVSGNKVADKIGRAGFHTTKAEHVNAPLIDELPMAVECEFVSYDEESNFLTGRIINVSADERILSEGKIDIAKLQPITYDPVHNNYYTLGKMNGKAFCDGKHIKEQQQADAKE